MCCSRCIRVGHLLGRDENLFSLFEGVKIDASTTNTRAERFAQMSNGALPSQLSTAAKESAALNLQVRKLEVARMWLLVCACALAWRVGTV